MNNPPSTNQPDPSAVMAGMKLSRDDVERLLRDDSADSRSDVLEKVTYHYNTKLLSEREQEIAEHIFRLLMRDISIRVREMLSERLKENPETPRDIILHMAQDSKTVSVPVLEVSPVLSDADLVSIVEASKDISKLLAISKRPHVSYRVSDALVNTNYVPVLTTLLNNQGAQVSEPALTRIATDFANESDVMQSLTAYPDLPLTVVERLIHTASAMVADQLKEKYKLSDENLKDDANKVREEFMLRLLEGALDEKEVIELVHNMAQKDTLSASIIVTALCQGQLLFFTVALAQIAGVSLPNAKHLLSDRGEYGFEGIYKKSGLPPSMANAVRLLLRGVQEMEQEGEVPGSSVYANRLVSHVVYQAGDQNIEYLPYFIALIRQNAHRK